MNETTNKTMNSEQNDEQTNKTKRDKIYTLNY